MCVLCYLLFLEVNELPGWLFMSSEAEGLPGMVCWDAGLCLYAQLGASVPHVVLNSTLC